MAILGVQLYSFSCLQTLLPRCTGDGISKRQSRNPWCSEPRDYFFFPFPFSSLRGISFLLGSVNSAILSFGYSRLSILENSSSINLFCKLLLRFDALKNESQKDLQSNSTLVLTHFPWGNKTESWKPVWISGKNREKYRESKRNLKTVSNHKSQEEMKIK